MSRIEEDGLEECDHCGHIFMDCICKEEDFVMTPQELKDAVNDANSYAEEIIQTQQLKRCRYKSRQGIECKIIRYTENSVTLLVFDNPEDPHEWTTNIDNFVKNYTLVS